MLRAALFFRAVGYANRTGSAIFAYNHHDRPLVAVFGCLEHTGIAGGTGQLYFQTQILSFALVEIDHLVGGIRRSERKAAAFG